MKTYEEITKKINEEKAIRKAHEYDWLEYSNLENVVNFLEGKIERYIRMYPDEYEYRYAFFTKQKIDDKDSFLKSIVEELENAKYINKGCKIKQDKKNEDVYYVKIDVLLFPISNTKRFAIKLVDMIYQFLPIFWTLVGIIISFVLWHTGLQVVSKIFFVGWIILAPIVSMFLDSQEAINRIIIGKNRS